jgi:hypothetical protein
MNDLKNNEITQQKIKELNYTILMTEFTTSLSSLLNSETAFHNLKKSNYNAKWTYKSKFEVTLQLCCSNSKIEYTIEFLATF